MVENGRFDFNLGEGIYCLVSRWNNFVNIGFRECKVFNNNGKERVYPTKSGINFMLNQYEKLIDASNDIFGGLFYGLPVDTVDLSWNTIVRVESGVETVKKLSIRNETKNRQISLTPDQFKLWLDQQNEINEKILEIQDYIKEKCCKPDGESAKEAKCLTPEQKPPEITDMRPKKRSIADDKLIEKKMKLCDESPSAKKDCKRPNLDLSKRKLFICSWPDATESPASPDNLNEKWEFVHTQDIDDDDFSASQFFE